MYKPLDDKIRKLRRPFTKELVEGWHKKDLEDVDKYTEKCFKYILRSLSDKGVYFDGIERVCPIEFYNTVTRSNNSGNKDFEISRNSFFGVRLKFYHIDERTSKRTDLKQPLIYLPFTNKHGDIYNRNSLYSLQYVLSERGPSVDGVRNKTIFIRVLGYKFKVTVELFKFYKVDTNGEAATRYPLGLKLPANRFYNSRKDRKIIERITPIPLLAWYVFANYGFTHAMKTFAECDFVIDYEEALIKSCPKNEGWEIYVNGGGIHPKCMSNRDSVAIEPGIAIRNRNRGYDVTPLGLQYAASLLFMFSVFSGEFDLGGIDNPEYWRLIIGYCSIRLGHKAPPETYLRQMVEHKISVEEYADDFTVDRYNKSNIPVKNTYELFNYLIINYSNIIRTYNPANLLHKEIACKEFLLENLIHAANDFKYTIRNKPNVTPKVIERELDSHFKLFGIDKSIRENNTILEQTGTDNPFIDYGLGIIRQTKSTVRNSTGSKKDEFDPNHPGSLIDASQGFVVSYQYATEPHPDGNAMFTTRVHIVHGKYIGLHEDDRELYEETVNRLAGR